jgi:Holliday junction resolvasome RuvABC DNA-binding subunit
MNVFAEGLPNGLETNRIVAANLGEMADLLEQQGADGFRVQAYRHAAETVGTLSRPLREIFQQSGIKGLINLPAVGTSIASAIVEMLETGRWVQLARLRGVTEPERLLRTVPGIGPELAHKLHDELHIDTLETLEVAAHDGRLEQLNGFGPRRVQMIKASLQERLGRRRLPRRHGSMVPPVGQLLDVDREYRERVARNDLRKIAPKRFNPRGEAWLPVLHTQRGEWDFTALFSNTARAHELQKTGDWVVIYFHADGTGESQNTVVTETSGPWRGYRVVRGREKDCADYHLKRKSERDAASVH